VLWNTHVRLKTHFSRAPVAAIQLEAYLSDQFNEVRMSISPTMRRADYNEGHAASLPISVDLPLPEPDVFHDPISFDCNATVNPSEAAHFKEHGFIVKRGLIRDAEVFVQIEDHMWNNVPRGLMRRDDPNSWIDTPGQCWTERDSLEVGMLLEGNWKMRSKEGIGTEPFLIGKIANHPNMRSIARILMGGTPALSRRVRGIYSVFPSRPGSVGRYRPHADYMAAHLSAMVISSEINPRGGGFIIWPGSHKRLHPYWRTVHGGTMISAKAEPFLTAREQILRDTMPVEFNGKPGDVIFWHPRALHSAGLNHSADNGSPAVRMIIPCDYQIAGRDYFDDEDYGPGADYQWWIDTRNFASDVAPSENNIWDDWGI
tara:strand:+ start:172 stop:1287 length:1116 start_codon:yes stop_codon:yes gene_type:complete